jgi:hypothetical protein
MHKKRRSGVEEWSRLDMKCKAADDTKSTLSRKQQQQQRASSCGLLFT